MTATMTVDADPVDEALTRRFLLDFPQEAALKIEAMPAEDAIAILGK